MVVYLKSAILMLQIAAVYPLSEEKPFIFKILFYIWRIFVLSSIAITFIQYVQFTHTKTNHALEDPAYILETCKIKSF